MATPVVAEDVDEATSIVSDHTWCMVVPRFLLPAIIL